ncbi:MAG TPA: hypothetical protein VN408_40835 [Actinoplanes sp.]|nr:hypothetical protein [Actinoplanes sp.]
MPVRKEAGAKGDDRSPVRSGAKGTDGRPVPGARRTPVAWIKAAESMAARSAELPDKGSAEHPSARPEEKKAGRALDYREEAAELLARSNDRRRRRTVSGQAKPSPGQAEPPAGPALPKSGRSDSPRPGSNGLRPGTDS